MRPVVNMSDVDRATGIGNIHKISGKDLACGSGDMLAERQTARQTDTQHTYSSLLRSRFSGRSTDAKANGSGNSSSHVAEVSATNCDGHQSCIPACKSASQSEWCEHDCRIICRLYIEPRWRWVRTAQEVNRSPQLFTLITKMNIDAAQCRWLFGSKLGFSRILESRSSAFSRCSRVRTWLRQKWTNFDEIWSTLSTLSVVGPGRFWERSAWQRELESQAKFCFCQVNNARLYRFPVRQILQNLNTTRRSVSRRILSEQNFQKNYRKQSLFQNNAKKWFLQRLATSGRHNSAMIIDRHYQMIPLRDV